MNLADLISIGKQAGQLLNKALDKLPDYEQRKLKEYFEFLDTYQKEMAREDKDHDYLMDLKERNDILLKTLLKEIV